MSSDYFIGALTRWIKKRALILALINGLFGWACVFYILRHGR